MVVTSSGMDGRLLAAAEALLRLRPPLAGALPPTLPEFLRHRCHELLSSYPTTLQEDEALLESGIEGPLETAVRYRLAKKRVLTSVAATFAAS